MLRPIHYFIGSSLAVHAAIVLLILKQAIPVTPLITTNASSAPVISVALQSTPPEQHSIHHQRRHSLRAVPPVPRRTAVAAPVTARHKPTKKPKIKSLAKASNPAYQATIHRKLIRDRVLSQLHVNLQQYFTYPPLARRQGWQGRVLLGFSVGADGIIRDIHVAAGSGYAILDSSAIAALTQVQRLRTAVSLQGQALELQIPVIYRLQGG